MPEKHLKTWIYPTPVGISVILLPLLLFIGGIDTKATSMITIGIALPALAVFSLLWLLGSLPAIRKAAKNPESRQVYLPDFMEPDVQKIVQVDPLRPEFLPGVRLFYCWRLRFGPFRKKVSIPLPSRGNGQTALSFPNRGKWAGSPFFLATDPFGLFALECRMGITQFTVVPPKTKDFSGHIPQSTLAKSSKASVRLQEDAKERQERRVYVPGDDPRRLDWKHFARTGDLLVRVGKEGLFYSKKVWMTVLCTPKLQQKSHYKELESCLQLTRTIATESKKKGQDIYLCLPGEKSWKNPACLDGDRNLLERLSSTEPGNMPPVEGLPKGDTLFVICRHNEPTRHAFGVTAEQCGLKNVVFISPQPLGKKPLSLHEWIFIGEGTDAV